MASGILSKGMKLSYKATDGSTFTDLTNLLEVPELGGDTESVEITTLADGAHLYIDGLKNYGDSIAFKFNYEGEQFNTLNALTGSCTWKVTLPDDATCTWTGTGTVKLDGGSVGAVITYTLNVKPDSEMIWA